MCFQLMQHSSPNCIYVYVWNWSNYGKAGFRSSVSQDSRWLWNNSCLSLRLISGCCEDKEGTYMLHLACWRDVMSRNSKQNTMNGRKLGPYVLCNCGLFYLLNLFLTDNSFAPDNRMAEIPLLRIPVLNGLESYTDSSLTLRVGSCP